MTSAPRSHSTTQSAATSGWHGVPQAVSSCGVPRDGENAPFCNSASSRFIAATRDLHKRTEETIGKSSSPVVLLSRCETMIYQSQCNTTQCNVQKLRTAAPSQDHGALSGRYPIGRDNLLCSQTRKSFRTPSPWSWGRRDPADYRRGTRLKLSVIISHQQFGAVSCCMFLFCFC